MSEENKKFLVTGGAGFIGSHLVDKLIEQGNEVVVVDNLSTGKEENLNPKAKFFNMDIQSLEIYGVFENEKPDAVFHFAAQINVRKSVEEPLKDAESNILGALNVFQALVEGGGGTENKKIVFASTGGAMYGDTDTVPTPEHHAEDPLSPYGIAKLAIEKYLKFYKETHGIEYAVLRFGNVYGPRQNAKGEAGVVAIFCEKFLNGEQPVINGSGEQTRDFVYVGDVVNASIKALEKGSGTYNIATEKETSVNEVFDEIKKALNVSFEKKHAPQKEGEQVRSCLNCEKAKDALGWKPETNFEQGIHKTTEWFSFNK